MATSDDTPLDDPETTEDYDEAVAADDICIETLDAIEAGHCPTCAQPVPSVRSLIIHHYTAHDERLRAEYRCDGCNQLDVRRAGQLRDSSGGDYCSLACAGETADNLDTTIIDYDDWPDDDSVCPTCDGEYANRRGMLVHHSRAHDSVIKIRRECQHCGDDVLTTMAEIDDGKGVYCDRECQDRGKAGGYIDEPNVVLTSSGNTGNNEVYHTRLDCPHVNSSMKTRDAEIQKAWDRDECQKCRRMRCLADDDDQ